MSLGNVLKLGNGFAGFSDYIPPAVWKPFDFMNAPLGTASGSNELSWQ